VRPEDGPQAATDPLAALRAPPAPTPVERVRAVIVRIPPDARPWVIALAAVITAALAVGGFVIFRGASGRAARTSDTSTEAGVPDLPFAGTTTASATTEAPPRVVAHAAGAVVHPGVYDLAAGSRVGDLIAAAGGVTSDGDADRLNLAAPLTDGVRLYVPRRGEAAIPAVAEPDEHAEKDPSGPAKEAPGPVDLNRATLEQLEELPGIGPSIGQAIIDHRDSNGPFRSVDDLLDVRGVGPARLEQLRPLVKV
jgi:competence protein ComEA